MSNRRRLGLLVAVISLVTLAAVITLGRGEDDETAAPRRVEVPSGRFSLEVPGDWGGLDPARAAELFTSNPALRPVVDAYGGEPAKFERLLSREMKLWAISRESENGFHPNLNVQVTKGRMTPMTTMESQLGAVGMRDLEVREVSSPIGDGYQVDYELGVICKGRMYVLQVGGRAVTITITTSERERTDELADDVLESLRPSDSA